MYVEIMALFTINFSNFHYNVIQRGCKAFSSRNYKIARNCIIYMLDYIAMQMRKLTLKRAIVILNPPILLFPRFMGAAQRLTFYQEMWETGKEWRTQPGFCSFHGIKSLPVGVLLLCWNGMPVLPRCSCSDQEPSPFFAAFP